MCYVKCENILVNVLVHLLKHLSFWLRCPSFILSKFASQFKVNLICCVGRDTRNLCHKFNYQGSCSQDYGSQGCKSQVPGTRFQDSGCQGPISQGPGCQDPLSESPRVPGFQVSGSWVLMSQVSESQVLGLRSWVSGSWVLCTRSWFYTIPFSLCQIKNFF